MLADNQANATTGTLTWTTPAEATSPPGAYAVNGAGLTALNYDFVEALGNASALTIQPSPVNANALTQARIAITAIEADLPSSLTDIQLAMLDPPPRVAATQGSDPVDSDIGSFEFNSGVALREGTPLRQRLAFLRIVQGGIKLPANQVQIDER